MRLEPDGFEFVAPVLLQVTLPTGSGVSPEREIPLSITGNKNLVSLGLLEPDAAQPTFFIQHFSSYAVVLSQKGMNATLSESEVRSRFGGDELERIQTATAEKLARERQRQLLGQDDGEVQIDSRSSSRWSRSRAAVCLRPRTSRLARTTARRAFKDL